MQIVQEMLEDMSNMQLVLEGLDFQFQRFARGDRIANPIQSTPKGYL